MINIPIANENGAVLKTSGKYCEEDIVVKPTLQSKEVATSSNGAVRVFTDENFAGMSEVVVMVDVPASDIHINAEGVSF